VEGFSLATQKSPACTAAAPFQLSRLTHLRW